MYRICGLSIIAAFIDSIQSYTKFRRKRLSVKLKKQSVHIMSMLRQRKNGCRSCVTDEIGDWQTRAMEGVTDEISDWQTRAMEGARDEISDWQTRAMMEGDSDMFNP